MLKFNIKYRIFLAILVATAAVVLSMSLIVRWSFNRGFLQYVNTVEQDRLENLAGELEQSFAENGSWEFLRNQPVNWLRLMIRTLPPGTVGPEQLARLERRLERRAERGERPAREPAPGPVAQFEKRVFLLDADHLPVFGPAEGAAELEPRPLLQNSRVIGYLGLIPRRGLEDAHQLRFVKEQKGTLGLVAGVMLLVSALISLPLAQRLVRPLKGLAEATHRLTAGHYTTRVPVSGDDELGQLARDFNTLALTLEQNERTRRQWVADISHELRTPLAVLRGEIEALQDGVRQPTPEAVGSLHAEVLHLARLIDDLYQLALSDLGSLDYRKEDLDLTATLGMALEGFRAAFAHQSLTLQADLPKHALPCFGDPDRLHQLFVNLLKNSLNYTDPGGRLEIRLTTAGRRALIDFQDSAPGVPPAALERIFERLYRVDSSRSRATGGAGLGLAICRNIVEAHGGLIHAAPSPLGGVWLHIELPLQEGTS